MADPTGTVGLSGAQQSDLALATSGGPKFMQRLQQLADATDKHEQAFAKLRVGQNITDALADAEAKRAASQDAQVRAGAVLADAQDKAQAALKRSSDAAKAADEAASKIKAKAEADAAKVIRDANEYAAKTRSDADDRVAAAMEQQRLAQQAHAKAVSAQTQQEVVAARARDAQAKAEGKAKELQDKIDRLTAAIRAVT